LLHRDRVEGIVRGRRGARIAAVTSGGAIPEIADFDVVEEPAGTFIGRLNEEFAIESNAGDVFLLGNTSWRIRRVEQARVGVENAHGAAPTIPFWIGESPARTVELPQSVSELREAVAARMNEPAGAIAWLVAETGLDAAGAGQVVAYVRETAAVLGVVPTIETVVAE